MITLESIFQDARFGVRILRRDRAVTATAVLSLALAIGACTASFSLIDALILRPLPIREPDKLVRLTYQQDKANGVGAELYDRLVKASRSRIDLFGNTWGSNQAIVFDDSGGEEERLQIEEISGDGFRILGIQPALGRSLTPADDGQAVAVLSHRFWTVQFGANPAVLGRWLSWQGKSFQIVGVMQKEFAGLVPGSLTDLWFPRAATFLGWEQIWGRLKRGVRAEGARQALQAAYTNFWRDHANESASSGLPASQLAGIVNARLDLRSAARGRAGWVRTDFERPLWILASVVGLVLLVACSNVANLLVARAAARRREMALRVSIGAGRMRLMQQLLVESGLLACTACILGLVFAATAAPFIVKLLSPSGYPAVYLDVRLDIRVLAFLALIAAFTTALYGLAPAMRASSASPQEALKAGGVKHSTRTGVLRPLLAAQVGFSFMVLFAGGQFLLSFQKLTHVSLGFSKQGVLLIDLQGQAPKGEEAQNIELPLLERIRSLPAVRAASMSRYALVEGQFGGVTTTPIRFPGRAPEPLKPRCLGVSPGFFAAMKIGILSGRDFVPRDIVPGSAAVIVNQTFARRYFAGENALGKRFDRIGDDRHPVAQEIVGVVRDTKYNNLREENSPTIYEPLRGINGTLEVRTTADPLTLTTVLRRSIREVNPALRVARVILQSTLIDNTLLRERLLAFIAGFLSLVAVALAAIGLYGMLSYSVVLRTKEIGIRVALGARQLRVVRLVIADSIPMLAAGLVAGIAGGFVLAGFAASLLFEVKPSGFWSLALPLACLLLTACGATAPPALRAAAVDPVAALREE